MPRITYLTPHFGVAGVLYPEDLPEVAAVGFKSIVSNLPDGESTKYPSAAEERDLARQAGLGFRHIPAVKSEVLGDRVVDAMSQALAELDGPVLAHCASGVRSAIAWAAAAARSQPVDCVLATLKAAGFELAALRDELEAQRGRSASAAIPEALDCRCAEQGRNG